MAKHKVNSKHMNQVRIIGGQFKRRNITFIDAEGLRPTPDRVRETLFNWLMSDVFDANVLDACAGSGVLGFEALSRGAKQVTFIESNLQQCQKLQETVSTLKVKQQSQIYNGKAEDIISTLKNNPYNLVFLDPPYLLNLWQTLIDQLMVHQLITNSTLIYVEADKSLAEIFNSDTILLTEVLKEKKIGQVNSWLIKLKI